MSSRPALRRIQDLQRANDELRRQNVVLRAALGDIVLMRDLIDIRGHALCVLCENPSDAGSRRLRVESGRLVHDGMPARRRVADR